MTTRTQYESQPKQQFWLPKQLAVMLHISAQKIYEAISNGQLPAEKIEGNYVISNKAMEAFLKNGNPFAL